MRVLINIRRPNSFEEAKRVVDYIEQDESICINSFYSATKNAVDRGSYVMSQSLNQKFQFVVSDLDEAKKFYTNFTNMNPTWKELHE